MRRSRLFALAALTTLAALLPSSAAASPSVSRVASGLDGPRGIAFFNGHMLVAESGHGGSDCFTAPGVPFPICVGDTSRISQVDRSTGMVTPLVTGLFSVSLGPEGTIGASGLSVDGGRILAQIGSTPREAPPDIAIAQQQAGRLISVHPDGSWDSVAPVGTVDYDYTTQFTEPDPATCGQCNGTQEHDANPTGLLATDGGAFVADSGSNTLDFVNKPGHIQIRLHDPWRDPNPGTAFPTDAVPTCVARGQNSLWVGELSGRLLQVHGTTFAPIELKDSSGNQLLTHVTGCTSDGKGNIYFVNLFGPGPAFTPPPASDFFIGDVVWFNSKSGAAGVLAGGLTFPYSDAIGPDGNLYVTDGAICGATPVAAPPCFSRTGGVIKIALPNESED